MQGQDGRQETKQNAKNAVEQYITQANPKI